MMKQFILTLFVLAAVLPVRADYINATTWLNFEGAANNSVVTPTILTNGTVGSTFLGWETITDGSAQTDGATPDITISSLASMNLFTPPSINGTIFAPTGGTNGMRFQMTNDHCIQTTFPGNGYDLSVGFFLRFNGPNVNSQPRDVMSMRADPSGAYQFLQIYDGPTKHFHTHWQDTSFAGGSGNDVNIQSNTWYWVTAKHVSAGQKYFISFYDPTNNYALIGTSSNTVAASTAVKCTTFQIGMIHYGSTSGDPNQRLQSMDIDNILIDTNGVFPLGPGGGPLIASSNVAPWATTCGIPGGIPAVTTIFTNFAAGATRNQIQNGIDNCPSNQVVKLAAGTFDCTAAPLDITRNGVVLRGAGQGNTFLATAEGSTGTGGVTIESGFLSGNAKIIPVLSGYSQGSSNLVLNAVDAALHTGFHITIDQTNDGVFVYNGPADPGGFLRTDISPEGDGLRCLSQTVEVTAISNSTNITIWPPLYWGYAANRSPQIYYRPSSSSVQNYIKYAGVEDLTVSNINTTTGIGVVMNRAAYCWLKNVGTINANDYHIHLLRSYRCEVRHCTANGSLDTAASHGYGYDMDYQSCANLFEDNIILNCRDFVKTSSGSAGNAILYNYHSNALSQAGGPNFTVHSGGAHSAHAMMNLFEGNITYSMVFDFYWGTSSHNTVYRNWLKALMPYSSQAGRALVFDTSNTWCTALGNILGTTNISTNITLFTAFANLKISPAAMDYDNQYASLRIGYFSDGDAGGGLNGTNQFNTHTIGGNWDYVNNTVPWYRPTNSEPLSNSLYYASKPAYFGTLAWPPFVATNATVGDTRIPAGYRATFGADPSDPTITAQPADRSVFASQNANFTVTASGATTVHYQWKKNGSNVGTDSSSYTLTSAQLSDSGAAITVVVSDVAGSLTSSTATLTVSADPVISVQPQDATVVSGNPASFSVTASGQTTLSYQWKESTDGGTVYNNISNGGVYGGATTATLAISNTTGMNARKYEVVVTDTAGSLTSSAATLTVTGGLPPTTKMTFTGGTGTSGGVRF